MLSKVVFPSSFNFDFPVAKLVDVHSKGVDKAWLEKRAAMFDDRLRDIKPEKGTALVHVITTGAGEAYGSNSNADYYNKTASEWVFPEPKRGGMVKIALDGGLMKYHSSYMNGKAGVYRNHADNKDVSKSYGKIAMECYNPRMERGELLLALPEEKWAKELDKIARDEPVLWSQGSTVPYDICSVCGHRRRTRDESCKHIADHPLELTKAGHQIFAINDKPTFHDISCVFRPADKTAFALRKVALAKAAGSVMRSDELAELMAYTPPPSALMDTLHGRYDRLGTLRKLAAMEEEFEKAAAEGRHHDILDAFGPGSGFDSLSDKVLSKLACDAQDAMGSMSRMRVLLPMPLFLKLVMGDKASHAEPFAEEARGLMPGLFRDMLGDRGLSDILNDGSYDGSAGCRKGVRDAVAGMIPSHGVGEPEVKRRMTITVMRKRPGEPARGFHIVKNASQQARALAGEYGRYLLSWARGKSDSELRAMVAGKL